MHTGAREATGNEEHSSTLPTGAGSGSQTEEADDSTDWRKDPEPGFRTAEQVLGTDEGVAAIPPDRFVST